MLRVYVAECRKRALSVVDACGLLYTFSLEPFDALAFVPLARLDLAPAGMVNAEAVLLSVAPVAVVLAAIGPGEDAMALFLVVDVLALVFAAIGPAEDATAVHFVVLPLAVVLATVGPGVNAHAMNVVFQEFSRVRRSIGPQELPATMFLTITVLAFVAGIVRPDLLAVTMLLVLEPVTLVAGTIRVMVLSETVGLVIFPLAVVDVTIGVNKSATAIGFVRLPVAFVEGAIDPNLDTTAVLAAELVPLAFVFGAVVECHEGALHADDVVGRGRGLEVERLQRVSDLHHQLAGLEDLLIRLSVRWLGEGRVLRFETILCLDRPAGNQTSKVSLHSEGSILSGLLGVVIGALTPSSLGFVRVKLSVVGFGTTARLSHIFLSNY